MELQELQERAAFLERAGPRAVITTVERDAFAVALVLQGYQVQRAHRMLFDPSDREYVLDNDGALQMIARIRYASEQGLAATIADALTKADRADKLAEAAQDLMRAFGGDVPRWLEKEADELARALLEYGNSFAKYRITPPNFDAPSSLQRRDGDRWVTLADYPTRAQSYAALLAVRAGEELPTEGKL